MQIGKKIAHAFLKSPIYYICLGYPKFERLYSTLCYPRKGSSEKGLKIVLNKQFDYGGQDITVTSFRKMFKKCKSTDSLWAYQINSFAWLRDLHEVGSNHARICARKLIKDWIKENSRWSEKNWEMGMIGKRLFFLINAYDFYGRSADNDFKHMLFTSMHKQEKHLKGFLKTAKDKGSYDYLQAVKGLIFANVYFAKNKDGLENNLKLLKNTLDLQVLEDGCHISRNIFVSFKVLRSLIDIDYVLKNSRSGSPDFLHNYIHHINKFIKSVIYKDGELPVFNGSFEYDPEKISEILRRVDFRVKTIQSFPLSGYEKIAAGKTNVLISSSTGIGDDRYYGVGSFEMQHDKKRIIVNCGAYVYKQKWKDALQETDAHSALIINKEDNLAYDAKVSRRNNKNSVSVLVENNGYELNCRAHNSRKILVSNDGNTIMGTDTVRNTTSKDVVVRFHLHPDVNISYSHNKKHLLLKVGKSSGWMFKTSEDSLTIEDSIYFGKGKSPQQTKQIVIREKIAKGENIIQWMFEKQG